jgi:site-specific recombinase XerD
MGVTITSKKGRLYISFTANKQRKLFTVRPTIKVSTKQIDTESQTIFTGNRREDKELNKILISNLNWFYETVERLEKYEKTQPTITLISRLHKEEFLTDKKPIPKTFNTALSNYLTHKEEIEGISGKSLLQYSQNFAKRLRLFLERYKYKNLEELDERFLRKFSKHLFDLNYSKATYSLTVDVFKNFCRYLMNQRLISADFYLQAREVLKSKTVNNLKDFALTLDEVKELHNFKGITKNQEFFKDVFIFNCVTGGMRHSDLSRIKVGDVDLNRKLLHVYTQKNKSYITIPLLPLAEEIIRKHNPKIDTDKNKERLLFDLGTSLNSINKRYKLIAKRFFKLDSEGNKIYPYRIHRQSIVETANKGHNVNYKPLFEFFKSSLCRRTFITILLDQSFTFEQIRLFTGHRSYKAFSAYPKLSQKSKTETLHRAFNIFSE